MLKHELSPADPSEGDGQGDRCRPRCLPRRAWLLWRLSGGGPDGTTGRDEVTTGRDEVTTGRHEEMTRGHRRQRTRPCGPHLRPARLEPLWSPPPSLSVSSRGAGRGRSPRKPLLAPVASLGRSAPCTRISTMHHATPHYTPLHHTPPHSTTLYHTTLRHTPLHSTPLHSTPPHHAPAL